MQGKSGVATTLARLADYPYRWDTGIVEIDKMANYEKTIPLDWINETHNGLREAFVAYARPLIEGELPPFYVNGLPQHITLNK